MQHTLPRPALPGACGLPSIVAMHAAPPARPAAADPSSSRPDRTPTATLAGRCSADVQALDARLRPEAGSACAATSPDPCC